MSWRRISACGAIQASKTAPREHSCPQQASEAASGRTLTAAEAGRHIRNYFQSFFGDPGAESQPLGSVVLTNREQDILNHISRGYLDKEIAHLLNISIWTVHNHVKNIYDKLGVHNRTEAVLKCLQR